MKSSIIVNHLYRKNAMRIMDKNTYLQIEKEINALFKEHEDCRMTDTLEEALEIARKKIITSKGWTYEEYLDAWYKVFTGKN
jgi:hypothetical protein